MLFLMILILSRITWGANTGSSIFYKRTERDCWSDDDIARLQVRKIFEQLIPPSITPDKVNDRYIKDILKYFRNALQIASLSEDGNTANILKEVLADTIGSHMRSEILPTTRFAYYAGHVSYRKVKELHDFYNELKILLNTQGLGWKPPESVPKWTNLTVEKIRIGTGKPVNSCAYLIMKRDAKSCLHFPPPKLDDDQKPSAIVLPFKSEGLFSLESKKSQNILVKYYTTASRCILRRSVDKCRHSDFVNFNNELWHWMKREVAPHLSDEKLYTAFGGVLRIAAAVQNYGKGLTRRNLFTYQDSGISKWHPWKALKESYIYVDAEWTRYLYVLVVFAIAIAIYLLQICYNCILGDDGCRCRESPKPSNDMDVEYANTDVNIPAMLPAPQSEKNAPIIKSYSSLLSSVKTQKVYDMLERKEKTMASVISDEDSTDGQSESSSVSKEHRQDYKRKIHKPRSDSPPKLETTITEMSVDTKRTRNISVCSDTTESSYASSTSGQSITSISSKTRHKLRKHDSISYSRILERARRAGKRVPKTKSTSLTDFDYKSVMTPP